MVLSAAVEFPCACTENQEKPGVSLYPVPGWFKSDASVLEDGEPERLGERKTSFSRTTQNVMWSGAVCSEGFQLQVHLYKIQLGCWQGLAHLVACKAKHNRTTFKVAVD